MDEDYPECFLIISLSFYNRYLYFTLYVHDLLNTYITLCICLCEWVIHTHIYSALQEIIELYGGLVLNPLTCK